MEEKGGAGLLFFEKVYTSARLSILCTCGGSYVVSSDRLPADPALDRQREDKIGEDGEGRLNNVREQGGECKTVRHIPSGSIVMNLNNVYLCTKDVPRNVSLSVQK